MTMKKKKYNARFPPARIKKIMQSDEDVGKVAQPVPVIISRALELFVENLLKKTNDITTQRGARTLTPSHLKMCIKSEKRFDFLKELVSSVPELQGDHDEPPTSAVGLDFTMSTLSAAAEKSATATSQDQIKNHTSNSASVKPPKLPRQLSTAPRPRGRPRTVSLDSESKIPKKRKKKRHPKFVDDDIEDLSDEMSNGPDEAFEMDNSSQLNVQQPPPPLVSSGNGSATGMPEQSNSVSVAPEAIVTCTVTTGLTAHINGGVNNGSSILGFTLSIPTTSMKSAPLTTLTNQNGGLTSETKDKQKLNEKLNSSPASASSVTSSALSLEQKTSSLSKNNKTAAVQQDQVDEDYDDC